MSDSAKEHRKDLNDLAAKLKHSFNDPSLLETAVTHSSVSTEQGSRLYSNERLEFLGDRVLGLVIAEILLERFPAEEEGALARRHTAMVRKEALAIVAREMGLGAYIRMTRGEEDGGGRENDSLLSDCCEAVIAALYLDGGLTVAGDFIRRNWESLLGRDLKPPKDNKTSLQEWLQAKGQPLPNYQEVGRRGPAHAPEFEMKVTTVTGETAAASGSSKRLAEQKAAGRLLEILKGDA